MEVTGQLKMKFETSAVSEKFKKRDFVLATDLTTPYPQFVTFQITQDKCSLLDQYNEGDEIKVQFNLKGKEWNGPQGVKYFNTLEAWRIEKVGAETSEPTTETAPAFSSSSDNQDLPF